MRRLETSKWKYCIECTSLHRRSAWKKPKKNCCPECVILDENLCCPPAGTAQICPCLGLPLRSRRRVIEKIHEHAVAPVRLAGPYWDGLFSPCQGKRNGFLGHTCATTSFPTIDAPDVAVTVYTELFLKATYRDLLLTGISEEQLQKDLPRGRISKGWSLNVMNEYSIRTSRKSYPRMPSCLSARMWISCRQFGNFSRIAASLSFRVAPGTRIHMSACGAR